MTLTEFLLARIAEDEAFALKADPFKQETWYTERRDVMGRQLLQGVAVDDAEFDEDVDVFTAATRDHAAHIARHDPARVLAECEAKRRIVELHEFDPNYGACWICALKDGFKHSDGWGDEPWPCSTIRILALPYADHPDWREEWRP